LAPYWKCRKKEIRTKRGRELKKEFEGDENTNKVEYVFLFVVLFLVDVESDKSDVKKKRRRKRKGKHLGEKRESYKGYEICVKLKLL
jgi:hypothetical protein